MFCDQCGEALTPDARFCARCGAPTGSMGGAAEHAMAATAPAPTSVAAVVGAPLPPLGAPPPPVFVAPTRSASTAPIPVVVRGLLGGLAGGIFTFVVIETLYKPDLGSLVDAFASDDVIVQLAVRFALLGGLVSLGTAVLVGIGRINAGEAVGLGAAALAIGLAGGAIGGALLDRLLVGNGEDVPWLYDLLRPESYEEYEWTARVGYVAVFVVMGLFAALAVGVGSRAIGSSVLGGLLAGVVAGIAVAAVLVDAQIEDATAVRFLVFGFPGVVIGLGIGLAQQVSEGGRRRRQEQRRGALAYGVPPGYAVPGYGTPGYETPPPRA